ncbi:MAG: hypothetical protein HYW90_04995 [Candidatus Sungbacteria bacterium]|nr:hypothetical protein [Candidatus Sungbacteria bacterium]
MTERIGKIVLTDKNAGKGHLLEIGPDGRVFEFWLGSVVSVDNQVREFPARLNGRVVLFTEDGGAASEVHDVGLKDGFRSFECGNHLDNVQMGSKRCSCGYFTCIKYKRCEVCALVERKCVLCETAL